MRVVLTVAFLFVAAAVPQAQAQTSADWDRYQGTWVRDLDKCTDDGDHLRFIISRGEINMYETHCRITRRARDGDGFLVDAACEAEGDKFTSRFLVSPAPRGRLQVTTLSFGRRSVDVVQRCPAERAQGPSGPAAVPRASAAAPPAAPPQPGAGDFEESALAQLSCNGKPFGLPAIIWLGRQSLIDVRRGAGFDSLACWTLRRPVSLAGLPLARVCFYDSDPLVASMWPQLYQRTAGTAPGSAFAVFSRRPVAEVRAWADRTLSPQGEPRWRIDEGSDDPAEVGVVCAREQRD